MKIQTVVDELSSVPENLQGLYKEGSDKKFYLQATDAEGNALQDVSGLRRAKQHEVEARTAAETERDALQQQLATIKEQQEAKTAEAVAAAEEAARANNDVSALDKSWNDKFNALSKTKDTEIQSLNALLQNSTVENTAILMANELAVEGSASVLLPHIRKRLSMEIKADKVNTVVLDAEGNRSALTHEELKNEIRNTAAYAPLITGSKGSGSGAANNQPGGGAANPKLNRSKMTAKEKSDYMREHGSKAYLELPNN